jgi:class 3 adenylate cyclase
VGTAVNLTQRMQAEAGGGQVLVSEPVVRHAKDCLTVERAFEAQLKGIREPVRLAVVRGCKDSEPETAEGERENGKE